jgi:tripartite-type tricarboxylate transporter receptor subunit TctC
MNQFLKYFIFLLIGLGMVIGPVQAATDWPSRPVTVVVVFKPGGGMDQTLLPLKPMLEKKLGQNFLYSYKPGAGGRIGWEVLFAKGADGYTIGGLIMPHYVNSTIFAKPKYKVDDLVPIGIQTGDFPFWFVRKDSPIKDMNNLIAEAKKRPNKVRVAIGSFTGEHYITVALIEKEAGVKFRVVNVGGGAKVMSNIVGGHFEVGVSRPASVLSIRNEIHGIGIVDAKRSPLYPDCKTFDEQLPESIRIPHLKQSTGMMVHRAFKENDPEGFQKLADTFKWAVHSEEYAKVLKRRGTPLTYMNPEEAAGFVKDMHVKMIQLTELLESNERV